MHHQRGSAPSAADLEDENERLRTALREIAYWTRDLSTSSLAGKINQIARTALGEPTP